MRTRAWLILVSLLVGLGAATALWARAPELPPDQRDDLYVRLRVLAEAMDLVQANYVEEVKPEDLVYGAVQGILARLDPHSSFLLPEMFQEMQEETEGAFAGIGIEVTMRDGRLTVVSPIEDSPAHRAGILAGDVIVAIEGDQTREFNLMDAVKRMRGPKGTRVTIQVVRKGTEMPLTFTLTRDVVRVRSVKSRRVGSVGVVRVAQFQQGTHAEVRAALQGLAGEGELDGLVLDLRNNPGGLLDQAVKVADVFLTEGTVVSTRGRDPEEEVVYTAREDGDEPSYPLVVLVNEGTASASEIVAGALQDHGKALVLGERTFGKGSVQTVLPLSDGSGLRITTALYYTPGDRSIQARGIVPDLEVPRGTVEVVRAVPPHGQLREEDLKGHFHGPRPDEAAPGAEAPVGGEAGKDLQLERAVDLLKGWKVFRRLDTRGQPPAPTAPRAP